MNRALAAVLLLAGLLAGSVVLAQPGSSSLGAVRVIDGPVGSDGLVLRVKRLANNPILAPNMDGGIGSNVQGPSLIKVPSWLENPLGRYYLYFADHKGSYIRLAYADHVEGPWQIYEPGSLQLAESHFLTEPAAIPENVAGSNRLAGSAQGPVEGVPAPLDSATKPHIASPDAHVRDDLQEIVLYYHGLERYRFQQSRVATSRDGLHFTARPGLITNSYLRAFEHDGGWYAMAMPGIFYRSKNGLEGFERGPLLFPPTMRHAALWKRGDKLLVFWTRVGDQPEHILLSVIEVSGDWSTWKPTDAVSVLRPEADWEGADRPLVPSVRDAINVRVNQLRDPALFHDQGRSFLLYAIAGESGIGIAEIWVDEG